MLKKKRDEYTYDNATPELFVWDETHTLSSTWSDINELNDDLSLDELKTVGYVVKENDDVVIVAQSVCSSDEIIGGIVLPKKAIKIRKKLK